MSSGDSFPALGPLRDDIPPIPPEAARQPRISLFESQKIRSICFLLSVAVVFNHAVTYDHVWDWQGYRTEPLAEGYFASAPAEVLIQQFISGALGRITNPVFFLVSGYLFFYGWRPDVSSWKRKIRRRAFTLLVPYIVWGFAGMALNYLNYVAYNWRVFFDSEMRGTYTTADVLLFFFNMYPPTQLWFLRDLMLMMLLGVPVLIWVVRARPALFFPLLLVAYLLSWQLVIVDKNGFCFFTLGAYLGYRQFSPQFANRRWKIAAVGIWLGVAALYTGLAIGTAWNLQWLFKAVVLAGIPGIWALYDAFPGSFLRLLETLSVFRFFVYMGFDPLLPILQRPLLGMAPQTQLAHLAIYFLLPLFVSAICILAAWILYRAAPPVYFVITGGRLPLQGEGTGKANL